MRETVYLFKFIFPPGDVSRNAKKKLKDIPKEAIPTYFNDYFLKKKQCNPSDYFQQNFVSFVDENYEESEEEEETPKKQNPDL